MNGGFGSVLFYLADSAMLVHLVLCGVLVRRLRDRPDAIGEFFAVPNELLGTPHRIKLLRVSYYWPWHQPKMQLRPLDGASRRLLIMARVSGLVVPLAWLAFFTLPW